MDLTRLWTKKESLSSDPLHGFYWEDMLRDQIIWGFTEAFSF